MCHFVGSSGILLAGIFTRGFVFHLLAVMLDHTPGGGPQNGVMAGDVADDTADGRPFEASFGKSHGGQQRKTYDFEEEEFAGLGNKPEPP